MSRSKHAKTLAARRRQNAMRKIAVDLAASGFLGRRIDTARKMETLMAILGDVAPGFPMHPDEARDRLVQMIARQVANFITIEQDPATRTWTARLDVLAPMARPERSMFDDLVDCFRELERYKRITLPTVLNHETFEQHGITIVPHNPERR